jgi:hypothetical protein
MNFAPFSFLNQSVDSNPPKITYILNMSGVTNDFNVTMTLLYDQGLGSQPFSYTFSNITSTGTFNSGPISTPGIKTTNGNPFGDLGGQYTICRNGVSRTIDSIRYVITKNAIGVVDETNLSDQSITACPTTVSRTSGSGASGLNIDNDLFTITITLVIK